MNTIPPYIGKPTVYLDHNILDIIVKHKPSDLVAILNDYQVVYSDETLREIKRTGLRGVEYLAVLKVLDAMYIKLLLTPAFDVAGDAIILIKDPFDAFEEYIANLEPIYEKMSMATSQSLLKFFGGRSDSNFDEISSEQVDAFEDVLLHLENLVRDDAYSHNFPDAAKSMQARVSEMRFAYAEAHRNSNSEIRKHVSDELNFSGVGIYRDVTGVGPVDLNNIKPPHVIEKIWDAHKDLNGYREHNFTIEQFLGIAYNHAYDRNMYIFEAALSAYLVLNVVGYYPDSGMKKERRFVAAMSDASHASIAVFADNLFSNDLAFVNKARAVYEFLQVKTEVFHVILNVRSCSS